MTKDQADMLLTQIRNWGRFCAFVESSDSDAAKKRFEVIEAFVRGLEDLPPEIAARGVEGRKP